MSLRPTDLDAEQELDLGRLRDALVARWWLPVAGILVGAILGYLVSLGGGGGYRATATVFLGQPLSPSGNAQIQSLATNPSTVGQIVHAEANVRKVAHETGLSVSKLRSGISSQSRGRRRAGSRRRRMRWRGSSSPASRGTRRRRSAG